ncbi:hypothetical protein N7475_001938 [Penicillium sp. IBT 31633x]|nr:hypothetical protein N7475_001938 [Penicillium sp. IBT 31633x]
MILAQTEQKKLGNKSAVSSLTSNMHEIMKNGGSRRGEIWREAEEVLAKKDLTSALPGLPITVFDTDN